MQNKSFYNRFSFLYPVVDFFLKSQKRVLFNELDELPKGKLLEIGVGNGSHLPRYKDHEVTGIDTSTAMLDIARKNNSGKIRLLEMNGQALSFDSQFFDYVVLSHVISVVDDPELLLAQVYRVMKPNGHLFILNHFTPDNWLRHVDSSFESIAKLLHFKSVFRMRDLPGIENFILKKEVSVDLTCYFKLLIYQNK